MARGRRLPAYLVRRLQSYRRRTLRRDWYSVSVDLTTSRMHSSASIGCECLKVFSRSPCRLIGLSIGDAPQYMYLRQFTPIADIPSRQRLRSSSSNDLLVDSCCQTETAYYWMSRLPCRRRSHMERPPYYRRHLSIISSHLQKTTKTASVSTFISWPSLIDTFTLCGLYGPLSAIAGNGWLHIALRYH